MAFAFKRTVTIDHTKVANSDQSSFPVPVYLSSANLKTVSNGGHVQNAQGYDIVLYSDSAGSSMAVFECESYDAVNGVWIGWLKVNNLSHTTDSVYYVFYGDATISTTRSNPSTWNGNYVRVHHFNDDGSGGLVLADSTSNFGSGTNHGGTLGTGIAAGGAAFDGAHYADLGAGATPTLASANYTVSCWAKLTGSVASNDFNLAGIISVAQNTPLDFSLRLDGFNGSNKQATFLHRDNYMGGGPVMTTNTWYHFACVFDSAVGCKFYANGSQVATNAVTTQGSSNGDVMLVAVDHASGDNRKFPGIIDELRVSAASLSADYVATEYNMGLDITAVVSLGTETAVAISATLASTLGAATLSGAGAVAVAATDATTLGNVTISAAGTAAVAASLASTLGTLTASAAGTVTVTASTAGTLGAVTASAAGAVAVTATESTTLQAASLSGAGAAAIVASSAASLDAVTLAAAGTVSGGSASGGVTQTLGTLTAAAAGTMLVSAGLAVTLGATSLHGRAGTRHVLISNTTATAQVGSYTVFNPVVYTADPSGI